MLKAKIQEDLITGLKAKDHERVEALRLVISDIKNKEIDSKIEMTDEEVVKLIRSVIKKLKEASEMFAKGGRNDLVDQNNAQISIYATYVPADLSDELVAQKVEEIMTENKTLFSENPKLIMPTVMKAMSGLADTQKIIAEIKKHTQ